MRYLAVIWIWIIGSLQGYAQPIEGCGHAKRHWLSEAGSSVSSPSVFDLQTVEMHFTIDPTVVALEGVVRYSAVALDTLVVIPIELSNTFNITQAQVNGHPAAFDHQPNYQLLLTLAQPISRGDTFTFSLAYAGMPGNGGFGSVGQATVVGSPLLWTLSQPYGARDWWPVTERLQDKIDTTSITIRTPETFRGVANGVPIQELVEFGLRTTTYQHTYPISPYLIAVAVGPYEKLSDTLTLQLGPLYVNNYVIPAEVTVVGEPLDRFNAAFVYLDSLFTPYPFMKEQYGHVRFGWAGGMEHQTISFVGSYNYELLVHELAHQWFGDWVTCGSWQDLWLNEGFATYISGLAYERFYKEQYWSLFLQVREDRILEQTNGSVFRVDTSSVSTLFDVRLTYFKAAWVLHQLRWVIGDEAFFAGCRGYLNDPSLQGGYARTSDLQYHMEQSSGQVLNEFFSDWVYGEGQPNYKVEWSKVGNQVRLTLTQTTSHPSVSLFEMPVPIRLVGPTSDTLIVIPQQRAVQSTIVLWDQPVEQVLFDPDNWLLGHGTVSAIPAGEMPFVVIQEGDGHYQVGLRLSNAPITQLSIYALSGQLVWSTQSPGTIAEVDLSDLAHGVYVLEGQTATQRWTQRILR